MEFKTIFHKLMYRLGIFLSGKQRKLSIFKIGDYKIKVFSGISEYVDLIDLYIFGMSRISGIDKYSVKNVVDLGGYVGDWAIWAIQEYPNSRAFVYEPNISSYTVALENVQNLNLSNRIKVHNVGISHTHGNGNIGNSQYNLGSHILVNDNNVGDVTLKSLASVVHEVGVIDLLKVDIEGMEYQLFFKTPNTVFDNINNVLLEFHPFGENVDLSELIKRFENLGYKEIKVRRNFFGQGLLQARK